MYKFIVAVTAILMISLIQIVNAESRNFNECYSNFSSRLLMGSMISPVKLNLNDPEIKQYITDVCTYYHDRTGVWLDFNGYVDPIIQREFMQTHTIPQSLNDFYNSMN